MSGAAFGSGLSFLTVYAWMGHFEELQLMRILIDMLDFPTLTYFE